MIPEFLSHRNGDGKAVLFRQPRLCCGTGQGRGLGCLAAVAGTPEQSHPVTCQQVHFSTSRARSVFCFLEIKPSLKVILTPLNENHVLLTEVMWLFVLTQKETRPGSLPSKGTQVFMAWSNAQPGLEMPSPVTGLVCRFLMQYGNISVRDGK